MFEYLPQTHPERRRLEFLIQRDGLLGALKFAEQTRRSYRRAILDKQSYAATNNQRRSYTESYLIFKRFLNNNRLFCHQNQIETYYGQN